jgi:hypothetical protein
VGVPDGRQEHGELVSAEAGDHVSRPHAVAEPVGDELKEPVADRVAQRVVDLLEPVEVEEQQADALVLARLRERLHGAQDQHLPVRQAGQAVMGGLVVAAQRQRGGEVHRSEGRHEQRHQGRRVRHHHRDQGCEPEERAVDEGLRADRRLDDAQDRLALVERDGGADQRGPDREVGERGQGEGRDVHAVGRPGGSGPRMDPERGERDGRRRAGQRHLPDVEHHVVPRPTVKRAADDHRDGLYQRRRRQAVVHEDREGEHRGGRGAADRGRGADHDGTQLAQHDEDGQHPKERGPRGVRQLADAEPYLRRYQRGEAHDDDGREVTPQGRAGARPGVARVGRGDLRSHHETARTGNLCTWPEIAR